MAGIPLEKDKIILIQKGDEFSFAETRENSYLHAGGVTHYAFYDTLEEAYQAAKELLPGWLTPEERMQARLDELKQKQEDPRQELSDRESREIQYLESKLD